MEIPFCVVKFGIKINVPIFKSVAGVKRELIWLFLDKCLCVFLSLFKINSVCVLEANFKVCR